MARAARGIIATQALTPRPNPCATGRSSAGPWDAIGRADVWRQQRQARKGRQAHQGRRDEWHRRPHDGRRQPPRGGRHHERSTGSDLVVEPGLEVDPVVGRQRAADAQPLADRTGLLPEGLLLVDAQWPDPGPVGAHAHDQERGLHPEQERGIEGVVGIRARRQPRHRVRDLAPDAGVDAVEASYRPFGRRAISEDHGQRRVQRPAQPSEGVRLEIAVRRHALGDERMRDLEEQGRRAGPEQHGLAVDAPHLAARAVEAQHGVGDSGAHAPLTPLTPLTPLGGIARGGGATASTGWTDTQRPSQVMRIRA